MSKKPKCPACDGLGYKVIGVPHQFTITKMETVPNVPELLGQHDMPDPNRPKYVQVEMRYCSVCGKDEYHRRGYCSYPHIECPVCKGNKEKRGQKKSNKRSKKLKQK